MRTYTSRSIIKPREWDSQSSKSLVYHHYNIREIEGADGLYKQYEYDVDEYEYDEWIKMNLNKVTEVEQQLTDTQLALCELYESVVK